MCRGRGDLERRGDGEQDLRLGRLLPPLVTLCTQHNKELSIYSGTPLILTETGQKKMHARVVLGVGKRGVLSSGVSLKGSTVYYKSPVHYVRQTYNISSGGEQYSFSLPGGGRGFVIQLSHQIVLGNIFIISIFFLLLLRLLLLLLGAGRRRGERELGEVHLITLGLLQLECVCACVCVCVCACVFEVRMLHVQYLVSDRCADLFAAVGFAPKFLLLPTKLQQT